MPTQEAKTPPQPLCENLLAKPCNPPALRQETAENSYERIRFARSIRFSTRCTEYRIEKSHSFIVLLIVVGCRLLEKRIRGTRAAKVIFP
jgi:hypothetical protein